MPRRHYRVVEDDEGEEEEVECASLWRMMGRSGGIGREHNEARHVLVKEEHVKVRRRERPQKLLRNA
jgi:hypothetical protein